MLKMKLKLLKLSTKLKLTLKLKFGNKNTSLAALGALTACNALPPAKSGKEFNSMSLDVQKSLC